MARPKTGTLTQLGPALWRLQATPSADPRVGAKPGAKRRLSRSFRGTKPEARAALQRLIVEAGCDLHGGATATVAELLDQFMATVSLAPTTRADWHSVISNHLLPALGDVPLWRLTPRVCDELYAELRNSGLGPSRVRCVHVVLHRALAQAVSWRWIAHNAVGDATRPEVPRTQICPPDAATVRVLLELAEHSDPEFHCWLQLAVATGARRGEVCGLRWSDIDFAGPSVRIERAVAATPAAGVYVKTTKTGSVRRVSITRLASDSLTTRFAEAQRASAAAGNGPVDAGDYVFSATHCAKTPMRPDLLTRRWQHLRAAAGAPTVRLHDLRHFVATELLTAGLDARTVANRLGHARTSTTMDIYWAFVPARDQDAADYLDRILAVPGPITTEVASGTHIGALET